MEDSKKLTELRKKIDDVDDQIVDLLNQRAQLALQARIAKGGRTVHRPQRENQILERVAKINQGPLSAEAIQTLFHSVIFVCRSIQEVENEPEPLVGLDRNFVTEQA
ncbi:MAG TPA: chorismate mutase [Candidatus Saccharimonadales bacterium]